MNNFFLFFVFFPQGYIQGLKSPPAREPQNPGPSASKKKEWKRSVSQPSARTVSASIHGTHPCVSPTTCQISWNAQVRFMVFDNWKLVKQFQKKICSYWHGFPTPIYFFRIFRQLKSCQNPWNAQVRFLKFDTFSWNAPWCVLSILTTFEVSKIRHKI